MHKFLAKIPKYPILGENSKKYPILGENPQNTQFWAKVPHFGRKSRNTLFWAKLPHFERKSRKRPILGENIPTQQKFRKHPMLGESLEDSRLWAKIPKISPFCAKTPINILFWAKIPCFWRKYPILAKTRKISHIWLKMPHFWRKFQVYNFFSERPRNTPIFSEKSKEYHTIINVLWRNTHKTQCLNWMRIPYTDYSPSKVNMENTY